MAESTYQVNGTARVSILALCFAQYSFLMLSQLSLVLFPLIMFCKDSSISKNRYWFWVYFSVNPSWSSKRKDKEAGLVFWYLMQQIGISEAAGIKKSYKIEGTQKFSASFRNLSLVSAISCIFKAQKTMLQHQRMPDCSQRNKHYRYQLQLWQV